MKLFSFINSWRSTAKSWDKVAIKVRLGKITLIDFYMDLRKRIGGLMVLNFGIRKNRKNG